MWEYDRLDLSDVPRRSDEADLLNGQGGQGTGCGHREWHRLLQAEDRLSHKACAPEARAQRVIHQEPGLLAR